MRIALKLFCAGILLGVATPALAKPAYVASTVNLRAAPGTTSEVLAKIPGGSLVDAGECSENWCAVPWQDKSGFAIQTSLDMSGRVPAQPRRVAAPRPVGPPTVYEDVPEYVEGPPVYYAPRPYYYGYGPYYGRGWGYRRRW
jgi:uncharacterized protein YraI